MKKLIKNKIIFIAFLGTEDNYENEAVILEEELENLNCDFYEIKSDYIFWKKVKHYIYWALV